MLSAAPVNRRFLTLACLAASLFGCEQVDYIELKPSEVVLKSPNDTIWLQAHPMSHTGVYYSRTHVSWSSKDPSIAKVDDTGKLTPVKSGTTSVVASAAGVTAEAPVEVLFAEKMAVEPTSLVLRVGQPAVELKAKAFDYLGRELKDRSPFFRSLNEEVVSMGQNSAFPVAPGQTQIEVKVEGLKQLVAVKVEPEKGAAKK